MSHTLSAAGFFFFMLLLASEGSSGQLFWQTKRHTCGTYTVPQICH